MVRACLNSSSGPFPSCAHPLFGWRYLVIFFHCHTASTGVRLIKLHGKSFQPLALGQILLLLTAKRNGKALVLCSFFSWPILFSNFANRTHNWIKAHAFLWRSTFSIIPRPTLWQRNIDINKVLSHCFALVIAPASPVKLVAIAVHNIGWVALDSVTASRETGRVVLMASLVPQAM